MARLLQTSAARYEGRDFEILEPLPTPDDGYYHPASPSLLTTTSEYERWYEASGHFKPDAPRVLIDFADGWRLGMNQATDAVIQAFEDGGFNAAAIFGTARAAPFALEYKPDILISRKHGRWWLGEPGVKVSTKSSTSRSSEASRCSSLASRSPTTGKPAPESGMPG